MSLEQNNEQHYREIVDKYHDPFANFQMRTWDYVLRPYVDGAAITVTLPPVTEAKGRFYSIMAGANVNNTNNVTITAIGSADWPEDVVLNEEGRGVIFYSDGLKWHYGEQHFTSSLVAGAVNLEEVHLTMDTAGAATVDVSIVRLESAVMLGNSAGAFFAQVNYDAAAAGVSGLSYAIGAEMILPNHAAIPSGHYTCIDYEMSLGDICDWGGGTKVSYMRFAAWGTQTSFDDNAFWFTLAAVEEVDHLVSVNAQTIRCQIEALTAGIDKERFVVLSTEQNILKHHSNVLTGAYGMDIQCTADDVISGGITAYFQANITGQPPGGGVVSGVGIWTNINEAPGTSIFRALDIGIYTAQDLAATELYGCYIDMSLGGAGIVGGRAFQMGFNHSGANALAGWFRAENPGAIGWAAEATDTATKTGDIVFQIGDTFHYIKTWDGPT